MNPPRGVNRGRLPFGLAICCLCLAHAFPAHAQPNPPEAGRNYADLASAALLKRAVEISTALSKAGYTPIESITNGEVALHGQAVHPSAKVTFSVCAYEFRDGLLETITRKDLFEDVGQSSPILRHLTNEVLTLTYDGAINRALDFLKLLSYDAVRIQGTHTLNIHDDLMTAHPRPRLDVNITPKLSGSAKASIYSPATRITFLATTGELLEASWLPKEALTRFLAIPAPAPISIPETPDFAPPIFVAATNTLPGVVSNVTAQTAITLITDLWQQLKTKAGTNTFKGVLVCDNLNQPAAVAETLNRLCGTIPWAGVSHAFRMDLPFAASLMAENKRGIAALAIAGKVDLEVLVVPDLDVDNPPSRDGTPDAMQKEYQRIQDQFAQRAAPLVGQLRLANNLPDHLVFLFEPSANFASSVINTELERQLRGMAMVESVMGAVGQGVTYAQNRVFSNAIAIVHLSGHLPLQTTPLSMAELGLTRLTNALPGTGIRVLQAHNEIHFVSGEVTLPFRNLAYGFGPHPMEDVLVMFGEKWVHFLQTAQRAKVFRVSQERARFEINSVAQPVTTGPKTTEGYNLLRTGETLDAASTHELADALLSEKNGHYLSACVFDPGVIFEIWNGEQSARLAVCFTCSEFSLTFYDEKGKPLHHLFSRFQSPELLKLALKGLPGDRGLEKRENPKPENTSE